MDVPAAKWDDPVCRQRSRAGRMARSLASDLPQDAPQLHPRGTLGLSVSPARERPGHRRQRRAAAFRASALELEAQEANFQSQCFLDIGIEQTLRLFHLFQIGHGVFGGQTSGNQGSGFPQPRVTAQRLVHFKSLQPDVAQPPLQSAQNTPQRKRRYSASTDAASSSSNRSRNSGSKSFSFSKGESAVSRSST
jgi:hypothetical protein